MKRSVLLLGAALVLSAESPASPKKPVFAFMGDNTVTKTKRIKLAGKPCMVTSRAVERKMGRKMECGPSDATFWNGERFNFVSVSEAGF